MRSDASRGQYARERVKIAEGNTYPVRQKGPLVQERFDECAVDRCALEEDRVACFCNVGLNGRVVHAF